QTDCLGTRLTELQGMRARAGGGRGGGGGGGGGEIHRASTPTGVTYMGTWEESVRQMKYDAGEWADGSVEAYMAASALRCRRQTGIAIPATDAESFIRGSADAGLLRILH